MLTQEELKSKLIYSPDTGLFTWINSSGRAMAGKIAGADSGKGYIQVSVNGKLYYAHRLAWLYVYGEPAGCGLQIDHINGIKSDNRISNLRVATNAQNRRNQSSRKNNKTGALGVHYSAKKRKFIAQAVVNGEHCYLGEFLTKDAAANAYNTFAKENHGEFYKGCAV